MSLAYRAQSTDRRLYGVFAGIVEDNEDPEHEGRVKLRFPWLDDATISDWCRVMQPYAGSGFGAVFVPEKQCEVLVSFVHGDMHEPIVLGGMYNGVDKPPTFKDGTQQDVKMLMTQAGNTVRLDDSAQSQGIEIQTVAGNDIFLDDQHGTITIKTTSGQQVVLDDQGAKLELSSIGGVGKITIDASGSITLQGTQITVTGTVITLAGKLNLG